MVGSITGTKLDEVQQLSPELSKESTVVDMDDAAASPESIKSAPISSPAGKSIPKRATVDIDDMAFQLGHMSASEKEEARIKRADAKQERLERMEEELLAFDSFETKASPYSCAMCSGTDEGSEMVVVQDPSDDWDASKWA